MVNTCVLAVDVDGGAFSIGPHKAVIGSITLTSDGSNYVNGGLAITKGQTTIASGQTFARALGFHKKIKQIHCEPLFDGDGTQQEGYVAAVNVSTGKLMLLGGAGATETALDEPNATALSTGTYVTRFLAIGD